MSKNRSFTGDDDALLTELGVEVEAKKKSQYTQREERIISGFEDIVNFYKEHGRAPQLSESADIFEKIYATRLSRLKDLEEAKSLLLEMDEHKLLSGEAPQLTDDMSDDDILSELAVEAPASSSITELKHVKPRSHINSADTVAARKKCEDFEKYKQTFIDVANDVKTGKRSTPLFKDDASISQGDFFILSGQILYIDKKGQDFTNKYDRIDSKLRVIYDNGTETPDMLMRSLQRALNKDENGRRIESDKNTKLFSENEEESDTQSGVIYVLRSDSEYPLVQENRDVIHKIGFTGSDVNKRITSAKFDPTFLMADVEVVATYKLANVNRARLEKLIHRFFADARLEIQIKDRFGKNVTANEWFMVPLFIIDEMIEKLKDGTLDKYKYDKDSAAIIAV